MTYVMYSTTINFSIFNFITIPSESEICNPLLELLATFGAEIIENLCSESRKRFFWGPELHNFPGKYGTGPP